jgi:hypothetical protein
VRSWFNAPLPCDAAVNDLQLIRDLEKYKFINRNLATVVLDKFKRHLWYLSPELVPLALFSEKVF